MLLKLSLILVLVSIFSCSLEAIGLLHSHGSNKNHDSNFSSLTGIKMPNHMSFNSVSSSTNNDCSLPTSTKPEKPQNDVFPGGIGPDSGMFKLQLKHRGLHHENEPKKSVAVSSARDLSRIQTLHTRVVEKKNQNTLSKQKKEPLPPAASSPESGISGQLVATLESGVSLGSGEYFIDVFIGTPPKHFSLILDTGSDLNWIQCVPCYDCFEQNGPYYDPKHSSSFRNITCHDERCNLVSSPDIHLSCKVENQTCPYYYWYGDSSNTTGDFALETFTVNLTSTELSSTESEFRRVENVMFGCGHWNRGLFHGAAGLLGFGRGPLSFLSQLKSVYGHSFSYCLVDRNSNTNVTSKLIFGEDKGLLSHPELNFTALVAGKENPVDTFYYVQIKSVMVGEDVLNIPEETWNVSSTGAGGTIIDSGTTLTYFADPAYQIIKAAFVKKIKGYEILEDFPILSPCYNVSGVENVELPEFGIRFADGAVWNFPVENYFIRLEKEVVCLAILGTPRSALSIIGNYQQQNFHILYDTKNSRLGYAPRSCADV